MSNLFGVMVFHISICIGMWGVDVSSVYVYSAICRNLFDVMVFHRHYCQMECGGRCISVYVYSAICEIYLV